MTAWLRKLLWGQIPVQTCAGIVYMTPEEKCKRDCVLRLLEGVTADSLDWRYMPTGVPVDVGDKTTLWIWCMTSQCRVDLRRAVGERGPMDTLRAACIPEAYALVEQRGEVERSKNGRRTFCVVADRLDAEKRA